MIQKHPKTLLTRFFSIWKMAQVWWRGNPMGTKYCLPIEKRQELSASRSSFCRCCCWYSFCKRVGNLTGRTGRSENQTTETAERFFLSSSSTLLHLAGASLLSHMRNRSSLSPQCSKPTVIDCDRCEIKSIGGEKRCKFKFLGSD